MLKKEDYDLVFFELSRFEEVLLNFVPNTTEVEDCIVSYINNFCIISKLFKIKDFTITFYTMAHNGNLNFETPRYGYSKISQEHMDIIPTINYMMDDLHHNSFYDKGEFFNMNITGEVKTISYEFYEIFLNINNHIRNRKYLSENTNQIQITIIRNHDDRTN